MSPKSSPSTSSHTEGSNSSDIVSMATSAHARNCVLTLRPLEEVGIALGVELGRVAEDEIAEVVLGDELLLYEFVRLVHYFADIGDIPVADVGAKDSLEARAEGIDVAVERPGVD